MTGEKQTKLNLDELEKAQTMVTDSGGAYTSEHSPTILELIKEVRTLREALEKVIKENTVMLNECTDKHDWEPDTSMTIIRCDRCGIGLNTHGARAALDGGDDENPRPIGR